MKKMSGFAKQLLTIPLMFLLIAFSAEAEFYKYVDENGNTLYTDDLNAVPIDQRKHLEKYEEAPLGPEVTSPAEASTSQLDLESRNASTDNLEKKLNQLLEKKKKLDAEYQALMEAREKLEIEKDAAKTNKAIKIHNENVSHFNEKTKVFEEKRKALEAEIEAYNTMIENTSGTKSDTVDTPSN